jgi:hypothetical protein
MTIHSSVSHRISPNSENIHKLTRKISLTPLSKPWYWADDSHLIYNSLTSAIPCLIHNSLTFAILRLTPTSHTTPRPLCGSLHSTTCSCTWPSPTLSPTTLMAGLFSSQTPSPVLHQHFSNLVHSTHTYMPMKLEQCSETSAYNLQTLGNYPK